MIAAAIMTAEEQQALGRWVRELRPELHGLPLVEIGTGVGGSARIIAAALVDSGNPAVLHTFDNLTMNPGRVARMTGGPTQRQALVALQEAHPNIRCHFTEFPGVMPLEQPLAVLLIDGDHRISAVLNDLEWADLVHSSGRLLLHDYGPNVHDFGPLRAFESWQAAHAFLGIHWHIIDRADSLIAVTRR